MSGVRPPNSNRLGDLVPQSTTSTPHNGVANKLNRTAIKLEVTNLDTNETTKYLSIGDAARALLAAYAGQPSLSIYLKSNRNKPFNPGREPEAPFGAEGGENI